MFIKLKNCLKITNDNEIHIYLYFGSIKSTKLLQLLYIGRLFIISTRTEYYNIVSQYWQKLNANIIQKQI